MSAEVEVVVVGGGIAGLAAAGLIARQGRSCVVLERASGFGGRAATTVRDGFHLNLGGHALYLAGAAGRVLRELGVNYSGNAPATGGGVAMLADEAHVLPTGLSTLLRTGLFGARGKLEFGRLLTRLPRLALAPLETVPLSAWLDAEVTDPRVRQAVEMLVRLTTYANAPGLLSAGAALRQLRLGAKPGVLYVDGGWQTLVDGLATAAKAAGARVVAAAGVEEVAPSGAGWTVRQSDGATWRARTVVLATGPRAAHKMAAGPAKAMLEVWADACVAARAACLDVALRALPRPAVRFALAVDDPLYFSVHSDAARLAPPGAVLVHAMKYLAPDDDKSPANHAKELEAWLDRCQPGWKAEVVTSRSLPDMIATNDLTRARACERGPGHRPGPEVPCAERLFVVGDWVGHEGMLADAALASAAEAATMIDVGGRAAQRVRALG